MSAAPALVSETEYGDGGPPDDPEAPMSAFEYVLIKLAASSPFMKAAVARAWAEVEAEVAHNTQTETEET